MANSKRRPQPTIASKNTNCDVPEFISHMSLEEANKLSINDKIDYRNIVGLYIPSVIIDKDDSHLMIRNIPYEWDPNKQYEFWTDYKFKNTLSKFAIYESISNRRKHSFFNLTMGDYIDVRPVTVFAPDREHKLWTIGEVVEFDPNSGQVKIVYIVDNCEQYQWSHLDNTNEIQPLQKKQPLNKPPIIIIAIDEQQQENNIRHQKKMSGHKRKNKSAKKTQEPKAKKMKLMRKTDKKKEKQNDKSISANCYLCGEHCSNLHEYKRHLRKHKKVQTVQTVQTFEDSYYVSVNCHFCKKHFNNMFKYSCHLQEHYDSDESKTWRHCDLGCKVNKDHEIQTSMFTGIFKSTAAFVAHIATHTFDRPFICNVAGCNKQTSTKGALKKHWEKYHEIRN